MLFNLQLTPLDIIIHIEELQKINMEDHDAWEMYYNLIENSATEVVHKAEKYKEKNIIWPSNVGYDIFMEHFMF